MVLLKLVYFFCVFHLTTASISLTDKCNLKDTSCLIAAVQKNVPGFAVGIPEMGIDILDVLKFDDIAFDLSGLQFTLKQGQLKGLKKAVIDDVKWDLSKKRFSLVFHFSGEIIGDYTAGGKLLLLPITGDGIMTLKIKNALINMHMDYELKNIDNKDFVIIKKYEYDYDVKDGAHFGLTNLFNGNEQLSKTMLTVINTNWKELTIDFGKPILEVIIKKVVKNIGQFLKKNSISDIASN